MNEKPKAPGRSERSGLSMLQLFEIFPDEDSARKWFEGIIWKKGRYCGHCGSTETSVVKSEKPMPYRCKICRKHFSVKVGTPMQSSNIPLRKWVMAIYLMTTKLKGTSSMHIHRELGISQSSAWHMIHRIREAWNLDGQRFDGPVEVDETFVGRLEGNKHRGKRLRSGRGPVGKTPVVRMKDRETRQVMAQVAGGTSRAILHGFVEEHVVAGSEVFTDDYPGDRGLDCKFDHETVKHSIGEYVNEQAHTNGIELFWSMLKRGYHGTYHKISPKPLGRYVNEFVGRHNIRGLDTRIQMAEIALSMRNKTLPYKKLVR